MKVKANISKAKKALAKKPPLYDLIKNPFIFLSLPENYRGLSEEKKEEFEKDYFLSMQIIAEEIFNEKFRKGVETKNAQSKENKGGKEKNISLKKPKNSFLLFCEEERKKNNSQKITQKELGKKFKNLSDEEKNIYKIKYEKNIQKEEEKLLLNIQLDSLGSVLGEIKEKKKEEENGKNLNNINLSPIKKE